MISLFIWIILVAIFLTWNIYSVRVLFNGYESDLIWKVSHAYWMSTIGSLIVIAIFGISAIITIPLWCQSHSDYDICQKIHKN